MTTGKDKRVGCFARLVYGLALGLFLLIGALGVAFSFELIPNNLLMIAVGVCSVFCVGFVLGSTVLARYGYNIPIPFIDY